MHSPVTTEMVPPKIVNRGGIIMIILIEPFY